MADCRHGVDKEDCIDCGAADRRTLALGSAASDTDVANDTDVRIDPPRASASREDDTAGERRRAEIREACRRALKLLET